MEVRFSLTRDDLWHYLNYVFLRRQLRIYLLVLIVCAVSLLFIVISNGSSFSLFELWPVLLFLVAFFLALWYSRDRAAKRGAGRGGVHVISIALEGIRQKTDLSEGIISWKAIKDIAQDRYNLYLIQDTGSRVVMAVVIPRRAFPTPQDAEMFLGQARQYWNGRGVL